MNMLERIFMAGGGAGAGEARMADLSDFCGPVLMIGCGNMAGAMLARWLACGLDPAQVTVVRPSGIAPAPGVRTLASLSEVSAPPRIALLGLKPQQLDSVVAPLAGLVGAETRLVSILAGTELAALRARFPAAGAIVRAMPNTPVALGRGVVGLYGDAAPEVEALMAPLGLVERVADEAAFAALTALAGSGPAFFFRMIDALAAAGAALGLAPDQALRLAVATADGAAGLAAAAAEPPARLADRVASPGGMTRAGLDVLDADRALVGLVERTLAAAVARGAEMAAATR